MFAFESTKLWKSAFEDDAETDRDQRQVLREALRSCRERAQVLAGEIARDLPEFTVHDISHLDALWEMADLVGW